VTYEKEITALLVIDPYNDFISQGGKIWDHIRAVAEANDCVPHMLQVLNAARNAGLRVFYRCIVDIARATTRPGGILRLSRRQRGSIRF
jgi:nicotinamidase-related amidase